MSEVTKPDPSHDFLDIPPHPLSTFFTPKSIAVIGATEKEESVGRTLMQNLLKGSFPGKIYPVNPKRDTILGLKCYPSIKDIPEKVDLVIIVTPAKTVPALIEECAKVDIRSVVIISAGFKELGMPGIALEKQILQEARKGHMRIIGPNCLGLMNPIFGLNATFAKDMAIPGHIAFISQSGAMCTAVLDWSLKEKIGFSAFVSIGSMADVNFGDLIDYLGNDPATESILLYMETVGDPRAFLSAARQVALSKPIIVIKAGRTLAAAKAAASHTGSLAGSDEVFDTALHRVGVLRVDSIAELFDMALVLSKQPVPKGPNLTIITNAGGPAVLATDAAVSSGANITVLTPNTIEKFNTFLPAAWSHSNPVDILGDADAERFAKAVDLLSHDGETDGLLVILSPQDMTDPVATAKSLIPYAKLHQKPILASWMGGQSVEEGIRILKESGIPSFSFPDSAATLFGKMWQHSEDLQKTYETPQLYSTDLQMAIKQGEVQRIFDTVKAQERTLLTEFEAKKVLEAYGIPTVKTIIAKSEEEAVSAASTLEYPVVVKVYSETITHKSDIGGVKLNLSNQAQVIEAFRDIRSSVKDKVGLEHFHGVTVQQMIKLEGYELILGSSVDEQFGPVILFGLGGQLVEVFKDKALALPPLNTTLARQLMKKTKVYNALLGVRGRPAVNLEKLENLLVRFSLLISEHPSIKECDINPLLASDQTLIALDARIVLHEPAIPIEALPKLAIRPYPIKYITSCILKNNAEVHLRPILPEDEPLVVKFHHELSEETVRNRYLELLSLDERTTHTRLIRICCSDYDRNLAIVAEHRVKDQKEILGIARLIKILGTKEAQFSITIIDRFQNVGLGTKLLNYLIQIAHEEGITCIRADILKGNQAMLKVCNKLNFQLRESKENPELIQARLKIKSFGKL